MPGEVRSADEALEALRALPVAAQTFGVLEAHADAWIVGGAVRDALIGRIPRELDVVVEGPIEPLAQALGGDLREHDRFGTATVVLEQGSVDLVQARSETYTRPGALPDVQPGSLQDDLARRDVSVNAIALNVAGGRMLHVDGALEDLAQGVLRVLHDRSFSDDPTRLWRVARYAARLGFAVHEHTATLAAAADPSTVSGARLGNELRLALGEPDPLAALAAARSLNDGLLPARMQTAPDGLADALALLPAGCRADLVVLAACCRTVDAADLVQWLGEMQFSSAECDIVAAGSRYSTYSPLRAAQSASAIARAARGAPLEVVALAGGPNARRWIDELRHVRLAITGDDLIVAGVPAGPQLGALLAHTLDLRLDGEIGDDRDEQLQAALAARE